MKHVLIALLLAIGMLHFSFAQQYNFAAIDNLLNTNLTSAYNGEVVCMIYKADSLLYYKALGGFDSTTTELIASATKNFSGVLMLKLAQEGHFKLDDTIGKYLPLATQVGKGGSTIRQNFSHTAGWSGTSGERFLGSTNLTLARCVDSILLNDPYTYAPGTRFRYTGVSMQVAARCAEVATGQTWNTLFQNKIAQPLGLKNTVFQLSGNQNPRVAGGISSSPADIMRFARFILNNGKVGNTQVVDSVWMQELWRDQTNRVPQLSSPYPDSPRYNNPFNQPIIYYGIGDWLDIYNPQRNYVEQISGAGAFGTIFWVNRCNGTAGVVFTSSSYSRALGTTFQIMDIVRNLVGGGCDENPPVMDTDTTSLDWTWSKSYGGTQLDFCRGVAADTFGNIFVTGDVRGTNVVLGDDIINFGTGSTGYILKFNEVGQVQWLQNFPGAGVDIDTDKDGTAVLTGTYSGRVNLGNNQVLNPVLGMREAMIIKYNPAGAPLWTAVLGSDGNDAGNEIATAADGSVLATGPFAGNAMRFPDGTTINKTGGADDVWLAKWDTNGNFLWGKTLAGTQHEEGRAISSDNAGNVLLAGEFDGNLTLNQTFATKGGSDIYVAKYSPNGDLLWGKTFGSIGDDAARGIDPAPDGGLYVSGEFSGTVAFDTFNLTSKGAKDIFLCKLNANGNVIWATSFGSPSTVSDIGCEIESDAAGNIYAAGSYSSGFSLPNGDVINAKGKRDQFLIKFNPNGEVLWIKTGGGSEDDLNFALGLDPQGRVTVVGSFEKDAVYGQTPPLQGFGSYDIFIAHLGFDKTPIDTTVVTPTDSIKSIVFEGKNRAYVEYVPSAYTNNNSERYPLVIALHGGGGNGVNFAESTKLNELAEREKFIVVHPNGSPLSSNNSNSYRWLTFQADDSDERFLLALTDTLLRQYRIDTTRIYMTGFSNGASMTMRMACNQTGRFAAVAPASGKWFWGADGKGAEAEFACVPTMRIPFLFTRGTLEDNLPTGRDTADVQGEIFWRSFNQCDTISVVDSISFAGQNLFREIYPNCASDQPNCNPLVSTRIHNIINASHGWQPSNSELIWNFLKQYRKDCSPTTRVDNRIELESIHIYPNPTNGLLQIETAISGQKTVQLFNVQGQMVQQFKTSDANFSVDVTALPDGVYVLKLQTTDGRMVVKKVLKQ